MPKKRVTRAKAVSPKKLEGVEVSEEISESERKEQLRIYLKDFDTKVRNGEKQVIKEKSLFRVKVNGVITHFMSQIPEAVLNMTIKDFAAIGGTLQAAQEWVKNKDKNKIRQEIGDLDVPHSFTDLEVIKEEENMDPSTLKTVRKTQKREQRTVQQSSRTAKSRVTPMNRMHYLYNATPMVTPKFDVTSKDTPENIRQARPGEMVMSMDGSPLRVA